VTRYVVRDDTQINHDGVVYAGGQVVEATPEEAADWVASGWVSEAADKPKPAKRAAAK
jgi:hypothetical protein